MPDSLSITDNRTGQTYEVPIQYGTYPKYGAAINALELRNIKVADDDFGLLAYDPSFGNTASCKSSIGIDFVMRSFNFPVEFSS